MVAIPKSFGIIQGPSTQTGSADVNMSYEQILPNALSKLGGDLQTLAIQQQRQKIAEDQAVTAAQLIGFKTQLSKFDNEKKQLFTDLSSSDLNQVTLEHNKAYDERTKFVTQQLEAHKNNPALLSLMKAQADTSSVDFEHDLGVEYSKKKRQFGQNQIYGSIYNINTQIESGGNVDNARRDLNETLNAGLKTGLIDMQDVIREKEKQAQIVIKKQKDYEEKVAFNTVINGQTYLDPSDNRSQKIIDSGFAKSALNNPNPEQLGYDISVNTGIIPTQFKNVLSGRLRMGSPQQQVDSASTMMDMIKKNPNLHFKDEDLRLANEMKNNMDINLPADQVVRYARDSLNKMDNLDVKARKDILDKKKYKEQIISSYDSLERKLKDEKGFDLFKGSVAVNPALRTHYEQLVRNAVISDGYSPEGALSAAEDKIRKEWAITDIGQRRLQRGAPEVFYSQFGDTSWIKGQLFSKIAEHELVSKAELDKYKIEPILDSLVNGRPSYKILKLNERYNSFDLVTYQNQPVIFRPNYAETEQGRKAKKERDLLHQNATEMDLLEAARDKLKPSKEQKAIALGASIK
jgi:hypothetical protein